MEKESLGDALQNEDTLHPCGMVLMALGCCLQNLISSGFCLKVNQAGTQPLCLSGYLWIPAHCIYVPEAKASLSSYTQCRSKCHPTELILIPNLQG